MHIPNNVKKAILYLSSLITVVVLIVSYLEGEFSDIAAKQTFAAVVLALILGIHLGRQRDP